MFHLVLFVNRVHMYVCLFHSMRRCVSTAWMVLIALLS